MAIPSLAMIPSGYKDGKVYSVLPTNGDGDFDFSRGSNATRVNKDGLIETMPLELGSELITNGGFDTDSGWAKGVGWTISGGTASKSAGTQSDLDQYSVTTSGSSYKVELTVSGVTAGSLSVRLGTSASAVIGSIDANGTHTFYGAVTTDLRLRIRADFEFVGSIDNVSVKEVLSGLDTPRLDYSDSSCPSLLLEPQRTNLISYSNKFDTYWSLLGLGTGTAPTINSNKAISPDGTQNATEVILNIGSGTTTSDRSSIEINQTVSQGSDYTISFYIKGKNNGDQLMIGAISGGYELITLTTEWERYTLTQTAASSPRAVFIGVRQGVFGTLNSNVEFYLYGAQLEEGSYATSYIPTQGSTATRYADVVADMTDLQSKSLLGVNQGTWFIDLKDMFFEITGTGVGSIVLYLDGSNQIEFVPKTDTSFKITLDNSVALDNISGENKIAISYDSSGLVIYKNGVSAYSTLSTSYSVAYNELHLSESTRPHRININNMKLYNTRLSNSELIALTS